MTYFKFHVNMNMLYTCHIPGIYLIYDNKNVIYQVYTRYILYIKSIYQVYTRYKNGINLTYDEVIHIPSIYLLKHF